jgi:hypothetical protein
MRHSYDVFEKFSDGSTLWRASVSGKYEAQRKMQELREISQNEFFVIDIQAVDLLTPKLAPKAWRPAAKRAAGPN